MNEQNAIKDIRENICTGKGSSILCRDECMYGERRCAYQLAMQALEKQIAKKVIYHDNCGNKTPYQPRCPRCYEAINEPYYMNGESCCPYCGQHIDWTVEE